MQTYPIRDKQEHAFAFEIENVYATPRAIGNLLRQVNEVSDVRVRKLFSKWEDIHVWFKFGETEYIVLEPFGDNSRYWIGPQVVGENPLNISDIENVFKSYRPPFLQEWFGNVLTLRLFGRH
jgi:hypothetical protein